MLTAIQPSSRNATEADIAISIISFNYSNQVDRSISESSSRFTQ